jgi:hypothetical protein
MHKQPLADTMVGAANQSITVNHHAATLPLMNDLRGECFKNNSKQTISSNCLRTFWCGSP